MNKQAGGAGAKEKLGMVDTQNFVHHCTRDATWPAPISNISQEIKPAF